MPLTPEGFIIDPQGVEVTVTITDLDGNPVTCYTEKDGDDVRVFDDGTFSEAFECWFEAVDPPQIRTSDKAVIRSDQSATDYQVSALFNGTEIATETGDRAVVEAHSWMPLRTFFVEIGGSAELAALLAAAQDSDNGGGDTFPPDGIDGALLASDGADGGRWTAQLPTPSSFGTSSDGGGFDAEHAINIYGRRPLVFYADDGSTVALVLNQEGSGYVRWSTSDGTEVGYYHINADDEYVEFVGTWAHATIDLPGRTGLAFYDVEPVAKADRATIATQAGTVSVEAFNALRDGLIALGLIIDAD